MQALKEVHRVSAPSQMEHGVESRSNPKIDFSVGRVVYKSALKRIHSFMHMLKVILRRVYG